MKIYESELMEVIHSTAKDLHAAGIMGKKTMREFDDMCLIEPEDLSPSEIRAIREKENVSQPVFAKYLNVTKNLVSAWERGIKKPGAPCRLLLSLVKRYGLKHISLS